MARSWTRRSFIGAILVCASAPPVSAQLLSVTDGITMVLNQFVDALPDTDATYRVAVDPMVNDIDRSQCEASKWLDQRSRLLVSARRQFDLVARPNMVFQVRQRAAARGGGGVYSRGLDDECCGPSIPQELVIRSTYHLVGETLRLTFDMLDPEAMTSLAVRQATLPCSALQEGLSFEPLDLTPQGLALNSQLAPPALEQSTGSLRLEIMPAKGEGAAYRHGEEMYLTVRASEDCYLQIHHISPEGEMSYLFPKYCRQPGEAECPREHWVPALAPDRQMKLAAGRVYILPEQTYGSDWIVGEPYGVDRFKAVASTQPFRSNVDLRARIVTGGSVKGLLEDLVAPATETAEAFATFRSSP